MRTKAKKLVDRIILLSESQIHLSDYPTEYKYKLALGFKICDYHIQRFKRKKVA